MSLADDLGEARMRDVRRHLKKPPSDSQVRKLFKVAMQSLGSLSGGLSATGQRDMARLIDDMAGRIQGISNRMVEVMGEGKLDEGYKKLVTSSVFFGGISRAIDTLFIDKELKRMEGITGSTFLASYTKDSAVIRWNVYGVNDGIDDPDGIRGEYRIELKLKKISDKPKGRPPAGM